MAQFLDPRLPERFWSKCIPEPNSGCWLWFASTTDGYGMFGVGQRVVRAHRVTYESLVGEVPAGLTLDHLCRERSCCNPLHLEPVTRGENVLRGESPIARCARVTHCPHGHPYDSTNTLFIRTKGGGRGRECRACRRARMRAWRERRLARSA